MRCFTISNIDRLVSIIIPCFNAEQYISEAIESALNQTYGAIEVIVIDDGSTDNSTDIIARYNKQVCFVKQENGGPGAARNRGLDLAKGDYIQFLDADDLLGPDKIERCLDQFKPDVGAVISSFEEFYDRRCETKANAFKQKIVCCFREKPYPWNKEDVPASVVRTAVGSSLPLHRAGLLRKVGCFRVDLWAMEDVELAFRLALSGDKIIWIEEKLVKVRNHQSVCRLRLAPGKNIEAIRAAYLMIEQAKCANWMTDDVKSALADLLANHGRKAYRMGYTDQATAAFDQAKLLSLNPRPTGIVLYNRLSKLVGLEKTEELVGSIENAFKKMLFKKV